MITKTSNKNEAKLFNIRIAECAKTFDIEQFNGAYIGAKLIFPDNFKTLRGLRFYVNMNFDNAEIYKRIYKIVVADAFAELDRTEENIIIGPFNAIGNNLEKIIDLTSYIVDSENNWVIIYADSAGGQWTLDTDTKLNSFLLEGWYETDEY